MTAAVLVWHERRDEKRNTKYWRLTTVLGTKVGMVSCRPKGRWRGDVHSYSTLGLPSYRSPEEYTHEAAIAHVERYLEDHSRQRFGKDDLTFLTWELESEAERETTGGRHWKHFDYADAERRAIAQYKEAMHFKQDAATTKFMKDYFG